MVHVSIIGVGLIGGSLGMALRRVRAQGRRPYHVTGVGRSDAKLKLAKRLGAIDRISTRYEEAVPASDIVVVCSPVQFIVPIVRKIAPLARPGTVFTDVGSVKSSIVNGAAVALRKRKNVAFVGGHPLAGSEKVGVRNASSDLFQNSVCVLTGGGVTGPSSRAVRLVQRMWADAGARCLHRSPREHDEILAYTSHLPHLLAFALFSSVSSLAKKKPVVRHLIAGSFRDMTRIAAADPEMWRGIAELNLRFLKEASRQFVKALSALLSSSPASFEKRVHRLALEKKRW